MIKEKMIFWPLLAVFIGVLIFGFASQGEKREAKDELLQDIELAAKKVSRKAGMVMHVMNSRMRPLAIWPQYMWPRPGDIIDRLMAVDGFLFVLLIGAPVIISGALQY